MRCIQAMRRRRREGAHTWVSGGLVLHQTVVTQHVQQSRLAGIVEAEKENLGVLVGQT